MIQQFNYYSDISGADLVVRECRVISKLLVKQATPQQWDEAIHVENLLQKRTSASAKRSATTIRKRLERLPRDLWLALRDGDNELATQIAFCGVLERNLLLVNFMETVLRDAYLSRSEKLEVYHWSDFVQDQSQRDPAIGAWKESTRTKIRQTVFRMLVDMGYLKSARTLELQRVLVRPELKAMLERHNRIRIKNCLEVSVWAR